MNDQWRPPDPYKHELEVIVAKIADHAWNELNRKTGDFKHRQEFIDKGIRTQAELREIITKGIEAKDTRAFRAQPSLEQGRVISRELYGVPLADPIKQPYELVVILNPDLKNGRLLGGTCFVSPDPQYLDKQLKIDIDGLQKNSKRVITPEMVIVMGGRPALREQESHRQLTVPSTNRIPIPGQEQKPQESVARVVPEPQPEVTQRPSVKVENLNLMPNQTPQPETETFAEQLLRQAAERGNSPKIVMPKGPEHRLEIKLNVRRPRRPGDDDEPL